MSHSITVESGKSLKLKTAGKYCDRDIVVTAEGGSSMVVCEQTDEVHAQHILALIEDLKVVSLPNAQTINESTFSTCKHLTRIDAPNVTSIGDGAFHDCTSLTDIYMPTLWTVNLYGFKGCTNLRRIDFPSLKTVICGSFEGCVNLSEVNLPQLTFIDTNAFANCSSLVKVDFPSVTDIGVEAFLNCTNLSTVILRTTEQPCIVGVTSFLNTKIMDENGMPTGQGFAYYPTSMDEAYRAVYEPAFAEMGLDGAFDYLFRKIEDYPDICG